MGLSDFLPRAHTLKFVTRCPMLHASRIRCCQRIRCCRMRCCRPDPLPNAKGILPPSIRCLKINTWPSPLLGNLALYPKMVCCQVIISHDSDSMVFKLIDIARQLALRPHVDGAAARRAERCVYGFSEGTVEAKSEEN